LQRNYHYSMKGKDKKKVALGPLTINRAVLTDKGNGETESLIKIRSFLHQSNNTRSQNCFRPISLIISK